MTFSAPLGQEGCMAYREGHVGSQGGLALAGRRPQEADRRPAGVERQDGPAVPGRRAGARLTSAPRSTLWTTRCLPRSSAPSSRGRCAPMVTAGRVRRPSRRHRALSAGGSAAVQIASGSGARASHQSPYAPALRAGGTRLGARRADDSARGRRPGRGGPARHGLDDAFGARRAGPPPRFRARIFTPVLSAIGSCTRCSAKTHTETAIEAAKRLGLFRGASGVLTPTHDTWVKLWHL